MFIFNKNFKFIVFKYKMLAFIFIIFITSSLTEYYNICIIMSKGKKTSRNRGHGEKYWRQKNKRDC